MQKFNLLKEKDKRAEVSFEEIHKGLPTFKVGSAQEASAIVDKICVLSKRTLAGNFFKTIEFISVSKGEFAEIREVGLRCDGCLLYIETKDTINYEDLFLSGIASHN